MVYSILSPWFWLAGVVFAIGFFFSCYLPGAWWIRKLKLSAWEHLLLSAVLGIILWGVQGYVFGYLHLRWLSFVYTGFFMWASWPQLASEKKHLATIINRFRHIKGADWPVLAMLAVGMSIQLLQVVGSGLRYDQGVAFFRVNAHDGVLHLSFIEALIRQFPPAQPGAIGFPISNYHYWSDLVMAELARVWSLPVSHSFFQFWPVILTTLTGLAVYLVVRNLGGSKAAAWWSLFFFYFGTDALYLLALVFIHRWGFELSAIDNGATQFLNMPHSFAKLIFLTGLLPLTNWVKTHDRKWGVLSVAILAPVIGFKVYFGMFASAGFSLVVAWQLLSTWIKQLRTMNLFSAAVKTLQQKHFHLLLLGVFALITLAIFLPPNKNAGGLFWSPLEWPKLFLGHQQLNVNEWWLRKQVYEEAGSIKGMIAVDTFAIAVGLICVFGTRLLGFLPNRTIYRQFPTEILMFLLPGTLLFTFLGLFTLQTSGLFNVFNFFAVACVPLALLSGWWISDLFESKKVALKILASVIVLLTLPRIAYHAYDAISDQLAFKYDEIFTPAQLEAMYFIRTRTSENSLVQSHIKNKYDFDTPYLSYFTNRQTYLTGVGMMRSHNQPVENRVEDMETVFASTSSLELSNKLRDRDIDYLYLLKTGEQTLPFKVEETNLKTVFENDETIIYQPI